MIWAGIGRPERWGFPAVYYDHNLFTIVLPKLRPFDVTKGRLYGSMGYMSECKYFGGVNTRFFVWKTAISALVLALATIHCLTAQPSNLNSSLGTTRQETPLSIDVSIVGLDPITWASDSPTLTHLGLEVSSGFEYTTAFRVPFRLELGYIGVTASSIASDGELYRGWAGFRCAFLTGYVFSPIALPFLGSLKVSALAGGAVTAAVYNELPLAYAYPSIIIEPRALIVLKSIVGQDSGPFFALPIELQFRSGIHTLVPGISIGFRYQFSREVT